MVKWACMVIFLSPRGEYYDINGLSDLTQDIVDGHWEIEDCAVVADCWTASLRRAARCGQDLGLKLEELTHKAEVGRDDAAALLDKLKGLVQLHAVGPHEESKSVVKGSRHRAVTASINVPSFFAWFKSKLRSSSSTTDWYPPDRSRFLVSSLGTMCSSPRPPLARLRTMVLKRTLVEPDMWAELKDRKDRQSSTRQPAGTSPSNKPRRDAQSIVGTSIMTIVGRRDRNATAPLGLLSALLTSSPPSPREYMVLLQNLRPGLSHMEDVSVHAQCTRHTEMCYLRKEEGEGRERFKDRNLTNHNKVQKLSSQFNLTPVCDESTCVLLQARKGWAYILLEVRKEIKHQMKE
ncbi:hypothetical protein FQN60_010426 [Etheostoma spectabile]|uniref:Uncharacterized protein n=1 Tax=Etheostoma spectabile TaxID=54343 RepID=A0A5J5DBE8_9PERO|nr:hypothetical protein FQN60_010426 [Etheostoma spectabile]